MNPPRATMLQAIAAARQSGADRIQGYVVYRRDAGPERFMFKALDGQGRIHFARQLLWDDYLLAVQHWLQVGPRRVQEAA
jgi:hypothetical protein